MAREQNPNIMILEAAADGLGPLANDLVFLGGCATGLLLTDVAAPAIRVTKDVDVITEATTLADYHRLSKQLSERGFVEDQSPDAPVCRWKAPGIVLDVMPTNPAILGFGNQWYEPAMAAAELVKLPSGKKIRMVTALHFLATKLEAFDGRGNGDYVLSHDMEDILAVLDGRPEIADEVTNSKDERLRKYLKKRFAALLTEQRFLEAMPGHLPGDAASQARVPLIIARIETIANQRFEP